MNDEEALISVVVPVYNVEKYLKKCVESILNQTYRNMEIILVDDGSPDSCPELCDEYGTHYKNVFVIHKENGGLSSARNAGIKLAHGDFISFIDSDDYIESTMYSHMIKAVKKYDSDIVICGLTCVDEDGIELQENIPMESGVYASDDIAMKILEGHWEYVTACNKLYRLGIVKEYLFPEGKIHEDEYTVHHFLGKTKTVAVISDHAYYYVMRGNSIAHSKLTVKNFDAVDAYYDKYKYYCCNGKKELADKTFQRIEGIYCDRRCLIQYAKKDKSDIKEIDKKFFDNFIQKSSHNILWRIIFKISPKAYAFLYKVQRRVALGKKGRIQ